MKQSLKHFKESGKDGRKIQTIPKVVPTPVRSSGKANGEPAEGSGAKKVEVPKEPETPNGTPETQEPEPPQESSEIKRKA